MRSYITVSVVADLFLALVCVFYLIPAIEQGIPAYSIALVLLAIAAQVVAAIRQWQRYHGVTHRVEEDARQMVDIVRQRLRMVEEWEK